VDRVTAFIIAGGKSSRMGKDKAFMQLGGETLLTRALRLAEVITKDIHIAGSTQTFSTFGRTVPDVFPSHGPLGGIHAALLASQTELNLMLAVDMPFVEADFLRYLISCAVQTAALVTAPYVNQRWQPLCAVYRREFAQIAEGELRKDKNRVDILLTRVNAHPVEVGELTRLGFSAEMFRNLNTPVDWLAAEREFAVSDPRPAILDRQPSAKRE
jgi:molybdopterin-guanine dinucleotide biosynthesis protein A